MEYRNRPIIKLGTIRIVEDYVDLDLARNAAYAFNLDFMNAKVQIEDDRRCGVACLTFASDSKTLSEALPSMKVYLE